MAKIVKTGPEPATTALAILDNDPQGHAEWRNEIETMPDVTPGDNLIVEWNEMFSVGVEDSRVANYDRLLPGKYTFEVENIDIYGIPTGEKAVLDVLVLPPFWKTTWFWGTSLALFTFVMFAGVRYAGTQKLKQEMVRSKSRETLERERIRIAQDIHDDLGARVTQISLISAMANRNAEFSDKARADFDQITRHARELVAALYETVWAVNPENDNLSALGNYLCQMVNQLCERAQFSCRFDVDELPRNVQASSQIRHNVTMVVKEAIHNVIKYANATEVTIGVAFKDNVLRVSVSDNGQGFQPSERQRSGHGLVNMQKRMEELGGSCQIESEPGRGTRVVMTLRFKSPKAY